MKTVSKPQINKSVNLRLLQKVVAPLLSDQELPEFIEKFISKVGAVPCLLWRDNKIQHELNLPIKEINWISHRPFDLSPHKDERHENGEYYALDKSSALAASPVITLKNVRSCLDLCAAPGGKSIFVSTALNPEVLFANEVISNRIGALISNLKRCQVKNAYVTSMDSKPICEQLAGGIDLIIADVPCSGQSIALDGKKDIGAFHHTTISKNVGRQRRILHNAMLALSEGGSLIYSTCTFSIEENEEIINWLIKKYPFLEPQNIAHLEQYRSSLSEFPSYRFFPHRGDGKGGFTCLLKNTRGGIKPTEDLNMDLAIRWRSDKHPV